MKKKNAKQNNDAEQTLITIPPQKKSREDAELAKKEKEEIDRQNELIKQIQESEEKLKFEQEQRKNLIEIKKKEIERKEKTILQMSETNQKLQQELEVLQVEVQEKLDKVEIKEKNEIFENEKKKRQEPLKQLLKTKEKELQDSLNIIEEYKKQKDELQRKLESKVDIVQVNSLNDQIKMAEAKLEDLEKEKNYLLKIQEEHSQCQVEQANLQKKIKELKENLELLKKENKDKVRADKFSVVPRSNYYGLTPDEIKDKKEQMIKNSLDEFWMKNKDKLINAANNEEDSLMEAKNSSNLSNSGRGNSLDNSKLKINRNKKYGEEVRNKNLDLDKNNELPIIPLFNNNEKKILMNVLPEKEIKKFEKRYECIDKERNNLQRKYALETKQLYKENKDLENKYEYSAIQLKENEQKNKLLTQQINQQQLEVEKLQQKLAKLIQNLEEQKSKVKVKDQENKQLVKQLQELQSKYEKAPVEEDEEEEQQEEN